MITNWKLFEDILNYKYAIIKFNNIFLPEIVEIVDFTIKNNLYSVEFIKKFDYWNYGLSKIVVKNLNGDISCAFTEDEIYKKSNNKRELQKELKFLITRTKYNL